VNRQIRSLGGGLVLSGALLCACTSLLGDFTIGQADATNGPDGGSEAGTTESGDGVGGPIAITPTEA
jgi:hypothetical protein